MDCSPPGSSVHGILQARTMEWVAMSSSNDHSAYFTPNPQSEDLCGTPSEWSSLKELMPSSVSVLDVWVLLPPRPHSGGRPHSRRSGSSLHEQTQHGNTISATKTEGGKPTGSTSLQSSHVHCRHSPRTVWTCLVVRAGPLFSS